MTDDDISQINPTPLGGSEARPADPSGSARVPGPVTAPGGPAPVAAPGEPGGSAIPGEDADDPASHCDETPTRGASGRSGRMGALPVVCLIAAILIAVDQVTKLWAVAALSGRARIPIIGDLLGLVLVRNPGAAFSLATGQTWIFSLVALVVVVVVVRASRGLGSRAWTITLGLVLGGAIGNLIDRIVRAPGFLHGHVVDFIDYGGQFVGNVADIAIVGAAGVIMVLSVLGVNLDGTRTGEDDDHHGADSAQGAVAATEGDGETRRSRRARRRDESGAVS
ncbi:MULTISPECIES: signal peptidase II [Actinomyces]|uniref:signal peptidase II n=1 Tax=Actinomyces TaxID=1654 RepID=UPI002E2B32D7|nr:MULTISPECIES: signal peptidase II [Actinomyces]